jgi:hypothetical protein
MVTMSPCHHLIEAVSYLTIHELLEGTRRRSRSAPGHDTSTLRGEGERVVAAIVSCKPCRTRTMYCLDVDAMRCDAMRCDAMRRGGDCFLMFLHVLLSCYPHRRGRVGVEVDVLCDVRRWMYG